MARIIVNVPVHPFPRSIRNEKGRKGSEGSKTKNEKRIRVLGNKPSQHVYCSAHAPSNPRYSAICRKVDRYHYGAGSGPKEPAKLNVQLYTADANERARVAKMRLQWWKEAA